jgi:hypothetical protein
VQIAVETRLAFHRGTRRRRVAGTELAAVLVQHVPIGTVHEAYRAADHFHIGCDGRVRDDARVGGWCIPGSGVGGYVDYPAAVWLRNINGSIDTATSASRGAT